MQSLRVPSLTNRLGIPTTGELLEVEREIRVPVRALYPYPYLNHASLDQIEPWR